MADVHPPVNLTLRLRSHVLDLDETRRNVWRTSEESLIVPAVQTAIITCDMWDEHWSRGANERVAKIVPRMEHVLHTAREAGVHIIHAPSDTMDFYQDAPARKRILEMPIVEPPAPIDMPEPPLPVDASDQGSDTNEPDWHKAWSRQHPHLSIDQEQDVISDDGRQIYSYLSRNRIEQVLIMGVHTNMCILNRSFAIKQMVRWGVDIALVRDLTDTMYNPAMSPYVSHEEGTALVVGYIERFWCPTVESGQILGVRG